MDVGTRLRELRESLNLSQYRLSKESGVAASAINKIESGNTRPTVDVLDRICSALGITLAEFFDDDAGDMPPDVRRLLNTIRTLTPEQRELLDKFLRAMNAD